MTEKESDYTSVAVRVISNEDKEKHWSEIPIHGYMPTFLAIAGNVDNISKRVRLSYLKRPAGIWKVRWNYRGSNSGYLIDLRTIVEDV